MNDIKLKDKQIKLEKALVALKVMLDKPVDPDRANIDATIQRFEFTIELTWKFLKQVLLLKGINAKSPRDVLKEAYQIELINDEEIWLKMLNDRNLSSHTYDESLADEIYVNIKTYYPVLEEMFNNCI